MNRNGANSAFRSGAGKEVKKISRNRIVRVRYESGVPASEEEALNQYSFLSLFQMNGFNCYYSAVPVGASAARTVSPFHSMTIALSDQGHVEYTNDGESQRQGKIQYSDILFWLAERPIYACWEKPLVFLSFGWEPAFLTRAAHESMDPDRIELPSQAPLRDPLLYSIGMTMWQQAQNGGMDKVYGETLASTLAVHTLRNYATYKPDLRPLAGRLSQAEMRRALDYIHDNLDHTLSLPEIAAVAGYSLHHFKRLFKATIGKPPHQYIIEQRVEKAKTLLLRGELSIAEVSALVGFCDQSHLHKHCKRLLGVTPKALQKQK